MNWFELSLRGRAESWRHLRGLRADPPVPAGSRDRKRTFQAALEQAEQQFRAASAVDPESRALNLFYGLSQAGRAIAAASPLLPNGDWRLNGHGLEFGKGQLNAAAVGGVEVKPIGGEQTSFRRLSAVLTSDVPGKVTLAEVWPLIYETAYGPRLGDPLFVPMAVSGKPTLSVGAFSTFSDSIRLPDAITRMGPEDLPTREEFLARYPALNGYLLAPPVTPAQPPQPWPPHDSSELALWWPAPNGPEAARVLDRRITRYRGHDIVYPTVADSSGTLHPLMAWWLVLFALSMLTRYRPEVWTAMIDVNASPHATAIEFVLDTALDSVPELLTEAIGSLHTTDRGL